LEIIVLSLSTHTHTYMHIMYILLFEDMFNLVTFLFLYRFLLKILIVLTRRIYLFR